MRYKIPIYKQILLQEYPYDGMQGD